MYDLKKKPLVGFFGRNKSTLSDFIHVVFSFHLTTFGVFECLARKKRFPCWSCTICFCPSLEYLRPPAYQAF